MYVAICVLISRRFESQDCHDKVRLTGVKTKNCIRSQSFVLLAITPVSAYDKHRRSVQRAAFYLEGEVDQ